MADYYETLQVHPSAEPEVIQAAYRRLSLKYHPDVNSSPAAGARMRELNEAYTVLADPIKRALYDRARAPRLGSASAFPSLSIEPKELDAGALEAGRPTTQVIHITNLGSGTLKGLLVSHVSWIMVSPPEFASNDLDIAVRLDPPRAGKYRYTKAIELFSNGGRTSIGVRANVAKAGSKADTSLEPSYSFDTPMTASIRTRKTSLWPSALWWMSLMALTSGVFWYLINPWLRSLPMIFGAGILGWRAAPRGFNPLQLGSGSGLRILAPKAVCSRCNARITSGRTGKCPRCSGYICQVCGQCDCGITWGHRRIP
ncbi:MAG: chaperone protein DnaJ [Dehalococcoidia bacterium]|nr:chaperone protein DnaJ [Dehalococcoidia bacterium]